MSAPDADALQRFHFEDTAVRGALVRLGASLDEILGQHFYPEPVARLLGEALAAVVLMGSTIKFAGSISLQAKSAGQVGLLFAESTHERQVRGYARVGSGPVRGGLGELLSAGTLAITITPEEGQRYQGIVPLDAPRLAPCLEHYFAQSEQLPSVILLACDGTAAAGLLLQSLPGGAHAPAAQAARWEHLRHLACTASDAELLGERFETLLYHLFHQERVRVQAPEAVRFGCRCSAERAGGTLRSLGETEARAILAEQGAILIHCEFCQQEYRYDAAALDRLFSVPPTGVPH